MISFHEDTKEEAEEKIKEYELRKQKEREEKLQMESQMEEEQLQESSEDIVEGSFPPFCKIVEVKIGSPADTGGLRPGDLLLKYGAVHSLNHNNLKAMVDVTKACYKKEIGVRIVRSGLEKELVVIPQEWDGPGILGCRFEVV